VGFDDAVITGEFKRLAQAFAAGATANSPSLPLTALVVQVLSSCYETF
jgi:tRNA (uracil-5-)-methyltransferase